MVISIPCAVLVVVLERESMHCLLLINLIEDIEIDGHTSYECPEVFFFGFSSFLGVTLGGRAVAVSA